MGVRQGVLLAAVCVTLSWGCGPGPTGAPLPDLPKPSPRVPRPQVAAPEDAADAGIVDTAARYGEALQREFGLSGVMLVARGDHVLIERSYGAASAEPQRAMTPETQFRIGSVTKLMTASAVFMAAEAGLIELDAPIVRWFPEPRRASWCSIDRAWRASR
jgi:CubicO group peptidase (beta-lactamase class C family)